MRLLFLGLAFPLPANNGVKMRSWALLRALAAEGHEITILTFAEPGEDQAEGGPLGQICREIDIVPLALNNLSSASGYLGRLRGLFFPEPYAVRRFSSPAMQERVRRHLKRDAYDAVVCDTIYTLVNLPSSSLPIVLNNVDVEHLILERYVACERNPVKRAYARLETRKVKQWEQRACQRAAVGMTCSEHDRELLQSLAPDLRLVIVPNTVDTDSYQPQAEGDSRTVIYQGGMDWFPNRDAVNYFVQDILPWLRREVAGVRFVVAGRNPSEAFQKRFAGVPDMTFTGTVPDMRPVIAQAAVCVVPLRIGSGTRLKILEASAMGKPVVSTRLGAEGLDFRDGEEIVLADHPEAFARAVASLLMDPSRRRSLGRAARNKVEEKYSFPVLRNAVARALAYIQTTKTQAKPKVQPQ